MCKELDRLWSEQVGEVVLFTWMSFLQDHLIQFLNIASPLILRHVVKNTTQVTTPSPVSVPLSWPLCSELYRSRCCTDTLSSHVPNSDDFHFAKGEDEMDNSIVGK